MTDITARQLQTKISDLWGQPVIVDNRAGASGNIALELAARSAPDGYTLFVGNVSTNAINEVRAERDQGLGKDRRREQHQGRMKDAYRVLHK